MPEPLNIDFADLDSIRASLPRAWEFLDVAQAGLAQAQKDVSYWRKVIYILSDRVGIDARIDPRSDRELIEPTGSADAPDSDALASPDSRSPLELVVEVVNREARKIKSRDVFRALRDEGHEVTMAQVSNALYYAAVTASPARLWRPKDRGFYAPHSYTEFGGQIPAIDLSEPYELAE